MKKKVILLKKLVVCVVLSALLGLNGCQQSYINESPKQFDNRMAWWREARFGMFIHWGLYAVPAGEWKGNTNHAEWILTTAQIPVAEYEKFAPQFNPVKFNASEWVRMAKQAGMKYIVITSKHHDGFCLFDSKHTDYDIMDATPFKRDIMEELSKECRKHGIKMCWYHSIMDWHHPDYLPRRAWEKRPAEGADFSRYVKYMKGQVKELVTNYGEIGVLWFDGEWEHTWNSELGDDLYYYVRSLQPNIIINNRVSVGRAGMAGTFDPKAFVGDFGTPEQEIPATGLGYDWETCMTMNNHWGYNKHDNNWKSTPDLIRKLVDIASKGGNFLLNVGPKADGTFPQASIDRLKEIGAWMKINGQSIYRTNASLFEHLSWGRCTSKGKKLYLHVFDWPQNGQLILPGLLTKVKSAYFLAEPKTKLDVRYDADSAIIQIPAIPIDSIDTVIVLDFAEEPEVATPPVIKADSDIFCDALKVEIISGLKRAQIHYTLNGVQPTQKSPRYNNPIELADTATIKCRVYRDDRAISPVVKRTFKKVTPRAAERLSSLSPGIKYDYFLGQWERIPDFNSMTSVGNGINKRFDISPKLQPEFFALRYTGYIKVQKDGVYTFYTNSDDGSRLYIADELVVDNDGLHGAQEVQGRIALAAGMHPVKVEYFQRAGGAVLDVFYSGPGIDRRVVTDDILFH